ncbi:MAG: organic solvent tolerance ABC transporter substrate-binding protein [Candidatus Rokuibacteriota bacterium]|nr:MAG: organic solvent tolerance ABC transporter substrate-binding protein [Candidatus Rokubacteria bacterium]PYN13587.1 MAG: organic solvent tolerance ABC transporter substrate-binding protein [Candidatus Rokubacteria bacterium]
MRTAWSTSEAPGRPVMEKALAAWLLVAAATAGTTTPTEVVQATVNRAITLVQDADLARPVNADKRRSELRRVAEDLFDFGEMSRRALARHWGECSSQEREEFVRLFTDLLERSYLSKIENWSGEKVLFVSETIDGDYAAVRSKIVTVRKQEVPVEYRLYRAGQRWQVYDVLFEGVSFIATYRSQFNRIIQASSFAGLMDKMREKEVEVVSADHHAGK